MENQNYSKDGKMKCTFCKKNLSGDDIWGREDLESRELGHSQLSNGICMQCLKEKYPRDYLTIQEERKLKNRNDFKKGFKDLYGHNS